MHREKEEIYSIKSYSFDRAKLGMFFSDKIQDTNDANENS